MIAGFMIAGFMIACIVCVCKNHLFRRTSPVRDSYGQWSICNDRSLYPVSTSPAKTQNRDNEDRTSTSHLDLVISIRMYRYVIFESQKVNFFESQSIGISSPKANSPPRVCLASPPGGEPQRPLPAMCAPFTQEWWHHHMTPVQEHPSLNEPLRRSAVVMSSYVPQKAAASRTLTIPAQLRV